MRWVREAEEEEGGGDFRTTRLVEVMHPSMGRVGW